MGRVCGAGSSRATTEPKRTGVTLTAPPIPYFGAKQQLASRIAALFPPHFHYVEPFAGSLAVLLAKTPSAQETVNDIDGDIMCFWKVLRDYPDELERLCALTPHSRAEYNAAFDRPEELSELERARRVWVSLTQSRGGRLQRIWWRHHPGTADPSVITPSLIARYMARLPPAARRIARVSLECRPALELIPSFTPHPNVLLYVDPPYLGSTRTSGGYQHDMRTENEHRALADALTGARCAVVISGYPSQLYDELYAGWHQVDIATGTAQGGAWAERVEVLWSNRPLSSQASLFDVE